MAQCLELIDVSRYYGGIAAVSHVDLRVDPGAIHAVIGPNGAGKTTLFHLISGVVPVSGGRILFEDKLISACKPHQISNYGIARTYQTASVFMNMTALENVMTGRHLRSRAGFFQTALRTSFARSEERSIREAALRWLEFMGVKDRYSCPLGTLPFVVHRKVEIARALAAEPKLLMLDEPAAGLNIRETAEMGELIQAIRRSGVTVLIIEHDMSLIMEISDRVSVLNYGSKIAEGAPREIQTNEDVIAAYLGRENPAHA